MGGESRTRATAPSWLSFRVAGQRKREEVWLWPAVFPGLNSTAIRGWWRLDLVTKQGKDALAKTLIALFCARNRRGEQFHHTGKPDEVDLWSPGSQMRWTNSLRVMNLGRDKMQKKPSLDLSHIPGEAWITALAGLAGCYPLLPLQGAFWEPSLRHDSHLFLCLQGLVIIYWRFSMPQQHLEQVGNTAFVKR